MSAVDLTDLWIVILVLGAGTFLIRFSFLGLVGDRQFPPWAERLLRYVPVAVMPALVAPLVVWPEATGGAPDPARLIAAFATMAVGAATRHTVLAVAGGMAALYTVLFLT